MPYPMADPEDQPNIAAQHQIKVAALPDNQDACAWENN